MGGLSPIHWLIFLTVVILVFGTKKLRNAGKDLGGAVKEFKNAIKEEGTVNQPADTIENDTIDSTASEKVKQQDNT